MKKADRVSGQLIVHDEENPSAALSERGITWQWTILTSRGFRVECSPTIYFTEDNAEAAGRRAADLLGIELLREQPAGRK